jgi:hypothetical protein
MGNKHRFQCILSSYVSGGGDSSNLYCMQSTCRILQFTATAARYSNGSNAALLNVHGSWLHQPVPRYLASNYYYYNLESGILDILQVLPSHISFSIQFHHVKSHQEDDHHTPTSTTNCAGRQAHSTDVEWTTTLHYTTLHYTTLHADSNS